MSIEALVVRFGLPAIALGAGLEGEAAAIAGGVLAHQGLVPLWGAGAAVVAGSFVADQLWFQAGRRFRDHRYVAALRRRPAFARAIRLLERHPLGFIFAFRFLYGLRTVSPIAIGTSGVRARTFVLVNLAAAIVWGTSAVLIGWFFGHAATAALGRVMPPRHVLVWGVLAVVALAALVGAVHWWRRERHA